MKTFTCHSAIILSLMYLTFYVLDRLNSAMSFIDNDITKALLLLLCALSVYNACAIQAKARARLRRKEEKRRQALRAARDARQAAGAARGK